MSDPTTGPLSELRPADAEHVGEIFPAAQRSALLKKILADEIKLAAGAPAPEITKPHSRRQSMGRTAGRVGELVPRRLVFAAVPVALAAAALVVVPSLGGSGTGLAEGAVLAHAAAALDQPNTILYVQTQSYGNAGVLCMANFSAASGSTTVSSPMCVGGSSDEAGTSGISANPADDTLNYSSQEWISPDQSQVHTIYNNGDELAQDRDAHNYQAYNPADNTLTTLTVPGATGPPPSSNTLSAPGPLAALITPLTLSFNISDTSYFEDLYQEAQAGEQNSSGRTTVTAQLVGQTTIDGESVYELSFAIQFMAPANPPAGGACDATGCTPPGAPPEFETLLYLDSQTFMPVRSVGMVSNTNDRPGFAPGTAVRDVTEFTVQSLPDTPANEALLQMSPHPGATQVNVDDTQPPASETGSTGTSGATDATGPTSEVGTTGSTGTTGASGSGASGVSGTPPAN